MQWTIYDCTLAHHRSTRVHPVSILRSRTESKLERRKLGIPLTTSMPSHIALLLCSWKKSRIASSDVYRSIYAVQESKYRCFSEASECTCWGISDQANFAGIVIWNPEDFSIVVIKIPTVFKPYLVISNRPLFPTSSKYSRTFVVLFSSPKFALMTACRELHRKIGQQDGLWAHVVRRVAYILVCTALVQPPISNTGEKWRTENVAWLP